MFPSQKQGLMLGLHVFPLSQLAPGVFLMPRAGGKADIVHRQ